LLWRTDWSARRRRDAAPPHTWNEEPPDVVQAVTTPAATAANKGAGLTAEEVPRSAAPPHIQSLWSG